MGKQKVEKKKRSPARQGTIGLGAAIEYFSRDYIVSIPLNDSQSYDLVIEKGGISQRVQVKTCGRKGGQYNKKYYNVCIKKCRNYELLFILLEDGRKFLIPKEELPGGMNLTLYKKYMKFLIQEEKGFEK